MLKVHHTKSCPCKSLVNFVYLLLEDTFCQNLDYCQSTSKPLPFSYCFRLNPLCWNILFCPLLNFLFVMLRRLQSGKQANEVFFCLLKKSQLGFGWIFLEAMFQQIIRKTCFFFGVGSLMSGKLKQKQTTATLNNGVAWEYCRWYFATPSLLVSLHFDHQKYYPNLTRHQHGISAFLRETTGNIAKWVWMCLLMI